MILIFLASFIASATTSSSKSNSENSTLEKGFTFGKEFDTKNCSLSHELKLEIQNYSSSVLKILEYTTSGEYEGKTYEKLSYFVDTFGPRISGHHQLERSLNFIRETLIQNGFSNVNDEEVTVRKPIKGSQACYMLEPRFKRIQVSGTLISSKTPTEGIISEIIIIPQSGSANFIRENADKISGKIAVFLAKGTEKEENIVLAQKLGAVAVLIRPKLTNSYQLVQARHTTYYKVTIPVGVTTHDGIDFLNRLYSRGTQVKLFLNLNQELGNSTSKNVIGEIPGLEKKDEYIYIAAHADSARAEGAQDDGFGVIIAMEAPIVLQNLNLSTRRTVRTLITTGEEMMMIGANEYVKAHEKEMDSIKGIIEADLGCSEVLGFIFGTNPDFGCILNEILELESMKTYFKDLNLRIDSRSGKDLTTDVQPFSQKGVPSAILNGVGRHGEYFRYYHTDADSMSSINSHELDKCLGIMTALAFVLADLKDDLPRGEIFK